jgi:hypothetical protein
MGRTSLPDLQFHHQRTYLSFLLPFSHQSAFQWKYWQEQQECQQELLLLLALLALLASVEFQQEQEILANLVLWQKLSERQLLALWAILLLEHCFHWRFVEQFVELQLETDLLALLHVEIQVRDLQFLELKAQEQHQSVVLLP